MLCGGTQPASVIAADITAARWTDINTPRSGAAGGWVLAPGSDLRHLAAAADGTLYACGQGLAYTLYKSTDSGRTWQSTGGVTDEITTIAASPVEPGTVFYATASRVYRSTDAGKTFLPLPSGPGNAGAGNTAITSLAVTWLNGNIVAACTADSDALEYGGVYVFDEGNGAAGWQDTGSGAFDVYGLAFSPNYAVDRFLATLTTDETDTYLFSRIADSAWNTYFPAARFNRNNSALPSPVAAARPASLVIPASFNALSGHDLAICAGISTGANTGDVYKVNLSPSAGAWPVVDLNAGGACGAADMDITGLAIAPAAVAATLIAGTNSGTLTSADGGSTWSGSAKAPTGSGAEILFAPDFSVTGKVFAASGGAGSALSVSFDLGVTWNQVSFIDTSIDNIVDVLPSPDYAQDNTLFMIASGDTGDLWRTTTGGADWERVFSTALYSVDSLLLITAPPRDGPDNRVIFVQGASQGKTAFWKSADNGQTYSRQFTADPATGLPFQTDAWAAAGTETLYFGSFNGTKGMVYRTANGGFFFSGAAPAGDHPIRSLALSPGFTTDGTILAGDAYGGVFLSTDAGLSFQPLPLYGVAPPLTGNVTVAFDSDFAANRIVYAAGDYPDAGIHRFTIGAGDAWQNIDATLPSGGKIDRLNFGPDAVLYAANMDTGGGMERSLDPRHAAGAAFETVTGGLSSNAVLCGLWQCGHRLWSIDTANNKLMTYLDTLTVPVSLKSPADKAAALGSLSGGAIKDVTLDWSGQDGATGYAWQCSDTADFSSIPAGLSGTTFAGSVRLPALEPGTTYYWRVRAASPVSSPWSEKRSFTTIMDMTIVPLNPLTPAAGATDVPVKPVFQWSAVTGAAGYDLVIAPDADFEHPALVRNGEYRLAANAWQCDVSLDEATTYYWKVRAAGAGTTSGWSAVGVFTTAVEPPPGVTTSPPQETAPILFEAAPTVPEQTEPEPAVTTAFTPAAPAPLSSQVLPLPAWVILLIGALLAIIILVLVILLAVVLKTRRGF